MSTHRKPTPVRNTIALLAFAALAALAVAAGTSAGAESTDAPAPTQTPQPVQSAELVAPAKPAKVQVTVVDQTAGQWGTLRRAIRGWNRSKLVHLHLAGDGRCQPGTYCIVVQATAAGKDAEWAGLTSYTQPGLATVQVNTSLDWYDADLQSAVVCHELGHALGGIPDGLTIGDGCIAGGDQTHPVPTKDDIAQLTATGNYPYGALAWAGVR